MPRLRPPSRKAGTMALAALEVLPGLHRRQAVSKRRHCQSNYVDGPARYDEKHAVRCLMPDPDARLPNQRGEMAAWYLIVVLYSV